MSDIVTLNGYKIKDEKAIRSYESVAQMKADTKLKEGYHVKTKGYYEANDGGHGEYVIVDDDSLVDDGGSIHVLSNGLRAKLIIENSSVNVHQFGAKGDGETNDLNAINNSINSNVKNINFISNKTYLCSQNIRIENKSNIIINGNNATILNETGTIEDISVEETSDSFIDIINCQNIIINNLIINNNANWYMRPHIDYGAGTSSEAWLIWLGIRKRTYSGLGIWGSNNVNVTNVKTMNSKVGFYIRASQKINLSKCVSNRTFADGIYICSTSKFIYVNNHYCEDTGDDCYSADGWESPHTPQYVYFTDCYALRSGGSLICADSSKHISYTNIYGEEINYSPFKYECNYGYADDINLYNVHAKTVQNPELGDQYAYVTGTQVTNFKITNVTVENSSIEYTGPSTRRIEWRHRNIDTLKYINCRIIGITPLFYVNTTNVLLENSYFETQDALSFIDYNYGKVTNCKILNKAYFSERAYSGLYFNKATYIILKDNTYSIDTAETHHDITFISAGNSNITFDTFDLNGYYGNLTNAEFYKPVLNSYFFPSCKDYQLAITGAGVGRIVSGEFVG